MQTMLQPQQAFAPPSPGGMDGIQAIDHPTRYPNTRQRKRKADGQDNNERLSKRLSLLNLENGGQKLYVPVENPKPSETFPTLSQQLLPPHSPLQPSSSSLLSSSTSSNPPSNTATTTTTTTLDDTMSLDDTKYKVYIYNLDDELSSSSSDISDTEPDNGRLVFLPDIDKHLRNNRIPIPKPILPNADGELAGMQLVLYSPAPSSLSVPEEQDSVRKAVIEARARVREKQSAERQGVWGAGGSWREPVRIPDVPGLSGVASPFPDAQLGVGGGDDDPDAMELD